jgi:hypothetical protein
MKLHWLLMPVLMFGLCFGAAYEQGETARREAEKSAKLTDIQITQNVKADRLATH